MILTVTLNAALDVTYEIDALVPHCSHRVRTVRERAGGKGVNVASVLGCLGVPAMATGLLGGRTGAQITGDLDARGLAHAFSSCAGASRRTVTVVSIADGDATIFNEPGPPVTPGEWSAFVEDLAGLILRVSATVVVLSGSLPRGVPDDAYAQLIVVAQAAGARTIVDAEGIPLRCAAAAHPDVVKPNLAELTAATGETDPVAGAAALRGLGALDVVVSLGGGGVLALPRDCRPLSARLRARLSGNPTGAGDAMVAALAAGLATGHDWPTMLADAVAWSAAAVLQPLAGAVDPADVARLAPDVEMEERDDAGQAR